MSSAGVSDAGLAESHKRTIKILGVNYTKCVRLMLCCKI